MWHTRPVTFPLAASTSGSAHLGNAHRLPDTAKRRLTVATLGAAMWPKSTSHPTLPRPVPGLILTGDRDGAVRDDNVVIRSREARTAGNSWNNSTQRPATDRLGHSLPMTRSRCWLPESVEVVETTGATNLAYQQFERHLAYVKLRHMKSITHDWLQVLHLRWLAQALHVGQSLRQSGTHNLAVLRHRIGVRQTTNRGHRICRIVCTTLSSLP
jgi:hypothetical protein